MQYGYYIVMVEYKRGPAEQSNPDETFVDKYEAESRAGELLQEYGITNAWVEYVNTIDEDLDPNGLGGE